MSNDINQVVIIGRLTRDCELKYTNSGTAISKFSLAVNRKKKQGDEWVEEVSYFDITLWAKQAEVLSQWLNKGKQVAVAGALRQNRWEQDGQKRSKVEIVASNVQLLSSDNKTQQSAENHSQVPSAKPQSNSQGDGIDDFQDDMLF